MQDRQEPVCRSAQHPPLNQGSFHHPSTRTTCKIDPYTPELDTEHAEWVGSRANDCVLSAVRVLLQQDGAVKTPQPHSRSGD
eukprot:230872-Amphidinium_carterae.1